MLKEIYCGSIVEIIHITKEALECIITAQKKRKNVNSNRDHAKANIQSCIRRLRRLLAANYRVGRDQSMVLTFNSSIKNYEDAVNEVKKFLYRLRYQANKAGIEPKYIYVISESNSTTQKAAHIHVHMIVNAEAVELVKECWKVGHVKSSKSLYYENGDFEALSCYLIKQACGHGNRFHTSHNLIQPEIEVIEGSVEEYEKSCAEIEADSTIQKIVEFSHYGCSYIRYKKDSLSDVNETLLPKQSSEKSATKDNICKVTFNQLGEQVDCITDISQVTRANVTKKERNTTSVESVCDKSYSPQKTVFWKIVMKCTQFINVVNKMIRDLLQLQNVK